MSTKPDKPTFSMHAAVLREPGRPMAIEPLELEGPRPDEVLVRLAGSGVCHTDIDFWRSGPAGDPVVLGHEGAGTVEAVGADGGAAGGAAGVRPGDAVVLSYASCGRCHECLAQRPAHCLYFWEANFGFARLDGSNAYAPSGVRGHFFGQSSFATHCIAGLRNLVPVTPDQHPDLDLALLGPLGCGLQTGAGTVLNSLAVQPGESLVVLGTGSVGLAAVMAAAAAGVEVIVAVDLLPSRLDLARELGASHAFRADKQAGDAGTAELEERIRAIPAVGARGVNHVVEITGHPAMERMAVNLLRPGGTMATLTGSPAPQHLPGGRTARAVIQGDAVPQQFILRLLELHRAGRFPFQRLLTSYPFEEVNRAMADSETGTTIKPVLRMVS